MPFTQFPSLVTCYITIVQYQNQKLTLVQYVPLVLCNLITFIAVILLQGNVSAETVSAETVKREVKQK